MRVKAEQRRAALDMLSAASRDERALAQLMADADGHAHTPGTLCAA